MGNVSGFCHVRYYPFFFSLCESVGGGVRDGFFAIQTCTEHDAQSAPLLVVFILF